MTAEPILPAYEVAAPAPVAGDLFAALRTALAAGYSEVVPTLHPEHTDLLRGGSPHLTDADRAAALFALAQVPGLSLGRIGPDLQRLLRVLGGALPLYAPHTPPAATGSPADAPQGPPSGEGTLARALSHLGLPTVTSEQLLSTIAGAIATAPDEVLAALELVPHVPKLRGALATERAQMLAHLPLAGVALSLILARRQDSRTVSE